MTNIAGIYLITNEKTHKVYVGSAKNLSRRWYEHRRRLNRNEHHSKKLQNAWNKYGESLFTFTVLLFCNESTLLFYEQRVIDHYKPYYNICQIAGSSLGRVCSKKTKNKIRNKNKGKLCSEETKERMRLAHLGKRPSLGLKRSEETKERMRLAHLGKEHTQENRDNISEKLKGRVFSEEHRAHLSEAAKGNQKWLGKTHTEETKRKMSLSKKKPKESSEQ